MYISGSGDSGGGGGGAVAHASRAPGLPLLPAVGARVRCKGLTGAAELNGCLGRVVSHEVRRCRLTVAKPVLKAPVVSALRTERTRQRVSGLHQRGFPVAPLVSVLEAVYNMMKRF